MRINTNLSAMIATNQMTKNTALAGNSMEKLSTGLRITKAGDDAAGLAISEKMRAQIRGMEQAERNVQDGISLVQTAEGALEESGNILQRMRELTVQGANDTLVTEDRDKIDTELKQLGEELGKIADETKFNGQELLKGKATLSTDNTTTVIEGTTINVQAGANKETREIVIANLASIASKVGGLKVTSTSVAQVSESSIDAALKEVNTARANLGAMQNRLEYTSSNLVTSTENLTAAESRIRDVDVAKEMVKLSKLNILNQASQAMVGQAKQQPESVAQLLR